MGLGTLLLGYYSLYLGFTIKWVCCWAFFRFFSVLLALFRVFSSILEGSWRYHVINLIACRSKRRSIANASALVLTGYFLFAFATLLLGGGGNSKGTLSTARLCCTASTLVIFIASI